MKIMIEMSFDKLFTAYANSLGDREMQYLCEKCNQRFAALWNIAANPMNPWNPRGGFARCPYCGTVHEKFICEAKQNEFMPYKVRLTLRESKGVVMVMNHYEAFCFTGRYTTDAVKGEEVFRFDVANRNATYIHRPDVRQKEQTEIALFSPFDTRLLSSSVLRFITSQSLIRLHHKKQVVDFMRQTRTLIETKIVQCRGYKPLESLYYPNVGADSGMFLLPFQNMAYRMVFDDLPQNALPHSYENIFYSNSPVSPLFPHVGEEIIRKAQTLRQRGASSVSALLQAAKVPDLPATQKKLREHVYHLEKLITAYSLCQNADFAARLFETLPSTVGNELIGYLRFIGQKYGEKTMVRVAEKKREYALADCATLYRQLNEENRAKINPRQIRLRDLHDFMSLAHRKQQAVRYSFEIPEHIVSRMEMQLDRLKFYLPKDSIELLEAGASLHNCVASYGEAVKDKNKLIALIAADNGAITGCLEIRGSTIVQAKCDRNKAVWTHEKLNEAVLEWAAKTNLTIDTPDILTNDERNRLAKTA